MTTGDSLLGCGGAPCHRSKWCPLTLQGLGAPSRNLRSSRAGVVSVSFIIVFVALRTHSVYSTNIYFSSFFPPIYKRYLAIHPSIYLSTYPSIHSSIYLSISLSMYPSIYLSIYLSIHPTIYLSISLSIYLSMYPSIYLSSIYLSVSMNLYV